MLGTTPSEAPREMLFGKGPTLLKLMGNARNYSLSLCYLFTLPQFINPFSYSYHHAAPKLGLKQQAERRNSVTWCSAVYYEMWEAPRVFQELGLHEGEGKTPSLSLPNRLEFPSLMC